MSSNRLKIKIKVEAFIELALNFFAVEEIKQELAEVIGNDTPYLNALNELLTEKIVEVKEIFKEYE